ncbi:MAG: P27 family phage terminase small subunit [Phycisphaerae bacterium]|nr:P27 family phage terminase small subunit [Phycisphaerae bacterium]
MKTKMVLPKGLSPEARDFYRKIAGGYSLNNAGLELLKVACFTLQRWREAKDVLDKSGLVIAGNIPRIHPAAKIEHDCRLSFCRMMKELGFSEELPE